MSSLEQYSDTYEILGKLNEGSGGIVYKAFHKRLKKEVVLKKMRGKAASQIVKRQEVDILKNLNHSFLPQVYDFLTVGDDVYTVMSYIPGKSFQEIMKEGVRFSKGQLIRWGMQLCSALDYLHSQKPPIIHGDIKPANVMLKPDGNICLIDFNISFFLDEGTVLGYSHGYTSPEQYIVVLDNRKTPSIKNYRSIDEKSDIYSVGATLYYLATGEKREDFSAPINRECLIERMGEVFAQIITRAMEIDPDRRFDDAYQMFQAFQGIAKRDKRYRTLVRRQYTVYAVLFVMLAGFIVLGGYGIHETNLERTEKYNSVVEEQIQAINGGDYEKAEEKYEEATGILPSALESYYQKARALYEQKEYDECAEFIDYDILENERLDLEQSRMTDVYYLEADSLFQLRNYAESADVYEELFSHGGYDSIYYRDYAITLAYAGNYGKAEEILEKAIQYGLGEDSIYYAKGEIEKALSESGKAIEDFRNCIENSEDDLLKERAYILLSQIYEAEDQIQEEKNILEEALNALPTEYQMRLLERWIQVNINLADSTGADGYRQKAVEGLLKVIEQGWDTYSTYDNLAVLYEKQKNLSSVQDVLSQMKEKFGEDYNVYKRYAFMEIDRQALLANSQRDYAAFKQYYERAVRLYEQDAQDDTEMQLLTQLYEQVRAGGWL